MKHAADNQTVALLFYLRVIPSQAQMPTLDMGHCNLTIGSLESYFSLCTSASLGRYTKPLN